MEKYVNKDTIIKNEIFNLFEESITCQICSNLIIEPTMCLQCQNTFCKNCIKDWMEKNKSCPNNCENPEYKDVVEKKNNITKFKFKCIKGCGEEIPFNDINSHYSTNCLSSKKKIKVLNSKQAAEYRRLTKKNIPKFVSMSII